MEYTATARYMRVSPQKARLVLDLIKGRRVEDALNTLHFTNKRIAPTVAKLLFSAIENAKYLSQEKGDDVDVDRLYVKNAIANEGPRLKRIRPAPMGRAFRYQRRMTHLEIHLAEKPGFLGTTAAAGTPAKASAKPKKKTVAKKAAVKKAPAKKKTAGKK